MKRRDPARVATGKPATGVRTVRLSTVSFFISALRGQRLAGLSCGGEYAFGVLAEDLALRCLVEAVQCGQRALRFGVADVERVIRAEHDAIGAGDLDRELDRLRR